MYTPRSTFRLGRKLKVLLLVGILASVVLAIPADAEPPVPDASIWVAGNAARAADGGTSFGDSVSFGHEMTGKVARNAYTTVVVQCWQGETMGYHWFGQPDFAFPLRDQNASQWTWDGGDATCTAELRYFAHNRISIVATTDFAVSGV